ncbi:ATPase PAAT [Takifugu flavidus]|nr:ATPase PAAT [Takifugu flavidus]
MVDIAVKSGSAWICPSQGPNLADILLSVHVSDENSNEQFIHSEEDQTNSVSPVLLERTEEGSTCILALCCSPSSNAAISRLLVVSEARNMEIYNQTGEYCGTARGERVTFVLSDISDRGPFYKKQLILDQPSPTCEVKLLSLAGRNSVLVCRVIVGLQQIGPCPALGPGIDMKQVQSLVNEMGTSLSPGAQNLMDMVQFQQQNQTGSLGGFLPLLMGGGVLSGPAQKDRISPEAFHPQPQPEHSRAAAVSITAPDETGPTQNGEVSVGSSDPLSHLINPEKKTNSQSRYPVSPAQISEMMSHLLKQQGCQQTLAAAGELLPALKSVCGQVSKLRLDNGAVETETRMTNGTWELDSTMERRLEEMERRLKEHVDRRLDALEQKLERTLLRVLPQFVLNQGSMSSTVGESAPNDAPGETTLTVAMQ